MPTAPPVSVWSPVLCKQGVGVVGPTTGFYGLPLETVPVTAPTSTGETTGRMISVPDTLVASGDGEVVGIVLVVLTVGLSASKTGLSQQSGPLFAGQLVVLVDRQPAVWVAGTTGGLLPGSVPLTVDFSVVTFG